MGYDYGHLITKFDVELRFVDQVQGGIPRHGEMIEAWLASRQMSDLAEQTAVEVDLVEEADKMWCGFKRDEHGLYLEDRQITALLKEASSMLGIARQNRGWRQVLQHGTFVKPARLYLGRDEPDGFDERVVHAMTPKGKISSFKRHDYVEKAEVSFQVWVTNGHPVVKPKPKPDKKTKGGKIRTDQELEEMEKARGGAEVFLRNSFAFSQDIGLGANRSQGFGKYNLLKFEKAE